MPTNHHDTKGSSKTLTLQLLVQKLKALNLAFWCRLEVIHVPGTTMITHGTDGLSIGICANGLNTDLKSFPVEIFLPALPYMSSTNWALSHIGVYEEYALWWNVDMDTRLWEPHKLMYNNTVWALSSGVVRRSFTTAIVVWVESPWDNSHLFLVPRI
jgi:hypothetical protein